MTDEENLMVNAEKLHKYQSLKKIATETVKDADNKVLNIVETGTAYLKGGDDVDLYLITESDFSLADLEKTRERFSVKGVEIHVYACTKDEFKAGEIVHNKEGRPLLQYLGGEQIGFDPHLEQVNFENPGMVNLFLLGTMRQFSGENRMPDVNIKDALAAVKVNHEDVREWVQLYTAAYLGCYQSDLSALDKAKYGERVAKFLIRTVHGDMMEHLIRAELTSYVDGLKNRLAMSVETNEGPDGVFVTDSLSASREIGEENIRLLTVANKLRQGVSGVKLKDIADLEEYLMYEVAHFRVDSRSLGKGGFETLSLLPLILLTREFTKGGIKEDLVSAGQRIIKAGDFEDWLYVVPPYRVDKNGNSVRNGEMIVSLDDRDVRLKPGRTVGEIGAFFNRPRSNDVRAGENPVHMTRVERDLIMDKLLLDREVINELNSGRLDSSKARAAHTLMLFTMFDVFNKFRDRAVGNKQAGDVVEDEEWLRKDNPLAEYLLGEVFLETVSRLELNERKKEGDKMVTRLEVGQREQVVCRKGDRVDGKFFVAGEGCEIHIKPEGSSGKIITLKEGGVFGEASLLGETTRSADVFAVGGVLYEIEADEFVRLAGRNNLIEGADVRANQLAYHIAAVGMRRMVGRGV